MRSHRSLLLALTLLFVGVARLSAQEDRPKASPADQKAQEAVKAYLQKLRGGGDAQLLSKDEAVLAKVFPNTRFVVARYRIYPIARVMPEGLKPSNVFAVGKDDRAHLVKDVPALQALLTRAAAPVKTEPAAKDALAAWLTLSQEFHQDGFYKFEVLEKEFAIGNDDPITVRGRAVVRQGGKGELAATLTFENGTLAKALENARIMEGPRPICQATLLLDANPLVRRIAENDLLFMGLPARDYLVEQRAKAGPELRREIDRVWQKIRESGW